MSDIKVKLEELLAATMRESASLDEDGLRQLEIRILGRKGEMNALMSVLPSLSPAERATLGATANVVKQKLEAALNHRRSALHRELEDDLGEKEWIDVTEPGTVNASGHLHPTNAAIDEIVALFNRIGFRRNRYRESEWDYYAFEALNMPKDHPARDEWETFFINTPPHQKFGKLVLTPHTSNAQRREMERRKPPIRMVSIGKCYRRQSDVTHSPLFHQFEGLVIDKGIALTHLRGVLNYFCKNYFGATRRVRLRPFHFMFTEPSFEIDISCASCNGTGNVAGIACRLCKSGWLELGGAGMVHPNVLAAGGVNPKEYSGFAFGWGVERTYMMREGLRIPDIRMIYNNDMRFLNQF